MAKYPLCVSDIIFKTSVRVDSFQQDQCRLFNSIIDSLDSRDPPSHIDLSFITLTIKPLKLLVDRLVRNRSVSVILLKGANLGDKGAGLIATLISRNRTILRMDLSRNLFSAKGMALIAAGLSKNNVLTSLDLSYNGIGCEGCQHLSEYLSKSICSLRWLNLFHNAIKDHGVKIISAALTLNKSLLFLNIGRNHITTKAAEFLGDGMRSNKVLNGLDLSYNGLDKQSVGFITKSLTVSSINALFLRGNKLGNEGAALIGDAVQRSRQLRCLDIRENGIDSSGISSLTSFKYSNLQVLLATVVVRDSALGSREEHVVVLDPRLMLTSPRNADQNMSDEGDSRSDDSTEWSQSTVSSTGGSELISDTRRYEDRNDFRQPIFEDRAGKKKADGYNREQPEVQRLSSWGLRHLLSDNRQTNIQKNI